MEGNIIALGAMQSLSYIYINSAQLIWFVRITRRSAFIKHVRENHPELHDELTPQYLDSLQLETGNDEAEAKEEVTVEEDMTNMSKSDFLVLLERRSD